MGQKDLSVHAAAADAIDPTLVIMQNNLAMVQSLQAGSGPSGISVAQVTSMSEIPDAATWPIVRSSLKALQAEAKRLAADNERMRSETEPEAARAGGESSVTRGKKKQFAAVSVGTTPSGAARPGAGKGTTLRSIRAAAT